MAEPPPEELVAVLQDLERRPFGPAFFAGHLRRFVRDRCPISGEALPVVELHLADGEVLDLCHVIGLAPSWAALAVWEDAPDGRVMRTEIVPYVFITRVTVRSTASTGAHIGFDSGREPAALEDSAMTPEEALRIAASASDESASPVASAPNS